MTTAAPSTALVTIRSAFTDAERLAPAGFLAGYRGLTREAYALDLRQFTNYPARAKYRPGNRPGHRRTHRRPGLPDRRRATAGPHGAGRIVRKVVRRAGITKIVTPHTLRHALSPPRWTLEFRCVTCKKPPLTPIRAPRCAMTGPAAAWTATLPTSSPPTSRAPPGDFTHPDSSVRQSQPPGGA